MTRKDLNYIKKLLLRIKPQDEHVTLAISYIDKDLASYNARKGQLKDMYEQDFRGAW